MIMTESRAKLASDAHALSRIEMLLVDYPDVSKDEEQEIGSYLRSASAMDIGLLSTNDEAWAKAQRYQKDHPSVFRTTLREFAVWALLAAFLAGVVLLLWDAGVAG